MPREPIDIRPGVYTKSGGREVMGLCIAIDNQDAQWEVITSDQYATVIKIKHGAKWNVEEYTDPNTGKRTVQIFREGAKLESLAQQFIHPKEEGYNSGGGGAAKGEGPQLKIYYTAPEDSHTPPRKKP